MIVYHTDCIAAKLSIKDHIFFLVFQQKQRKKVNREIDLLGGKSGLKQKVGRDSTIKSADKNPHRNKSMISKPFRNGYDKAFFQFNRLVSSLI